jgi:hypothetical protein
MSQDSRLDNGCFLLFVAHQWASYGQHVSYLQQRIKRTARTGPNRYFEMTYNAQSIRNYNKKTIDDDEKEELSEIVRVN